jgi:adenylyltransferase/sulfurtransferase
MTNLEEENARLRQRIAELEAAQKVPEPLTPNDKTTPFEKVNKLTNHEIYRFGRQLVTPNFGYECKQK